MREQRMVFDEDAELYDRARPGYPAGLFDDLFDYAALDDDSRILEIGAGTGKASVSLAQRGHPLLCLEPGLNMARVARANLADHPRAELLVTPFEEWPAEDACFGLVASAQAFHWVDAAVRYTRSAAALVPGGCLALFWNRPMPTSGPLEERIQSHYEVHAPHLARKPPGGRQIVVNPYGDELEACGLFDDVEYRSYGWSQAYTADEYCALMGTQSDHRLVEAAAHGRLLAGIYAAIEESGGRREVDYTADLYLTRRLR
jgi:SAM-dependent methyltransferase